MLLKCSLKKKGKQEENEAVQRVLLYYRLLLLGVAPSSQDVQGEEGARKEGEKTICPPGRAPAPRVLWQW